jgi:hypothetical protein
VVAPPKRKNPRNMSGIEPCIAAKTTIIAPAAATK